MLGSGSYGSVYQAVHIETQKTVAIKHVKLQSQQKSEENYQRSIILAIRELEILAKLSQIRNNFYTIKLLDCFTTDEADNDPANLSDIFLVTDCYDADLLTILRKKRIVLDKHKTITLIYNFLVSLIFLHNQGIVHRDLKPSNILVTEFCQIKFCDFGMARRKVGLTDLSDAEKSSKYKERTMSPIIQTRYYRAPEVILQKKNYDERVDVWSFGCIVSEILKNQHKNEAGRDFNEYLDNLILFQGGSSFPISPDNENISQTCQISSKDQMIKILQVLNKQDKLDKSFFDIASMHKFYDMAYNYANQPLNKEPGIRSQHQGIDPEMVDLVEKLVQINPDDRMTLE